MVKIIGFSGGCIEFHGDGQIRSLVGFDGVQNQPCHGDIMVI